MLNVQCGMLSCMWTLGIWVEISVFGEGKVGLKKTQVIDLIPIFLYAKENIKTMASKVKGQSLRNMFVR